MPKGAGLQGKQKKRPPAAQLDEGIQEKLAKLMEDADKVFGPPPSYNAANDKSGKSVGLRTLTEKVELIDPAAIEIGTSAREDPDVEVKELARHLCHIGMIHPILVTHDLRLIAGGRRLRAAKIAKLKRVPVVRVPVGADPSLLEVAENFCRVPLTNMETAVLFKKWIDAEPSRTQASLAQQLGLSPSRVSSVLVLLAAPKVDKKETVKETMERGRKARQATRKKAAKKEAPKKAPPKKQGKPKLIRQDVLPETLPPGVNRVSVTSETVRLDMTIPHNGKKNSLTRPKITDALDKLLRPLIHDIQDLMAIVVTEQAAQEGE